MKRLGSLLAVLTLALVTMLAVQGAQATTISPGEVKSFSGTATAPGYGSGPVYNTDINQNTAVFGQFSLDLTDATELYGLVKSSVNDAFITIGIAFYDSTGTNDICCYGWSNNQATANPGVLAAGSYIVKIWGILASGVSSVGYSGFVAAFETSPSITPTPIPAALPLFLTAIGGLGVLARRRQKAAVAA